MHLDNILCIIQFKRRNFFTTLLRILICLIRPRYSYDNLAENLATFLSKTARKKKKLNKKTGLLLLHPMNFTSFVDQ